MFWGWSLIVTGALVVASFAADQPQTVLSLPCAQVDPASPGCTPSPQALKKAKAAFSRAMQFEKQQRIDEAYEEFDAAARLVPRNIDYLTALAITRAELVSNHLKQGNAYLQNGAQVEAQAEFRSALNLDPQNQFAQQRMQDALREWAPRIDAEIRVLEQAGEIRVTPKAGLQGFHFRGDSQELLTTVAAAFGVTAVLDESVPSRHVHFDIDGADFPIAMQAAGQVTGSFWTPLAETEVLIAKDTTENHLRFDRLALRTFAVGTGKSQQELAEYTNLLRTIFEIKFVQQAQAGVITVRAPLPILDAATQFLENVGKERPQVVLDIQVFEIDHQLTRNLGVHIPNNFNLFSIPAAALAALGGQNIQSLINQFISGGGINQASATGLSGLLAQLQGQASSIFSQPLATFGGGLTFAGLSLDQIMAQLSVNESWVRQLDHVTLRAGQGTDADFKLGQRYPIINASFAPIFNSAAISKVLQNGSFQAPVPSFSYEDLGLDIKAKPTISANSEVDLQLEMDIRNLAGQSLNGVPVIANRQFKGSISLQNGEPAVVASSLTLSELLSMSGIPGLGLVPGLNKITTTNTRTAEENELLVVITPHVVDLEPGQSAEIWVKK